MNQWPDESMTRWHDDPIRAIMQPGDTKLRRMEARHAGLIQKVDAMFDAFATVKAVTAMVRAQYGGAISLSAIANYRCRVWKVERDRRRREQARQAAWEEFVREVRA
jgi:hypothetical protein